MLGEWVDTTLGDFLTLQRGFDLPRKDRTDGPYPVIASTGPVGSNNKAMVKGPGVVIGRSGSIGGGQYIQGDFWPLNTTLWVRDFKGNDRRFCYYMLRTIDFSQYNAGSGVPTLNRNHVHPLPICVPQFHEQQAISCILSALDDKIELNRRMNRTLEAMARAIFKSWFVDFEPVRAKAAGGVPSDLTSRIADLFPDSFEDSEFGKIPKGWEIGSILKIADLLSGGTPKTSIEEYWNGDIPWASAKDVSQCGEAFLIQTERKISELGLTNSSTKIIPAFSSVVVARGATTGRMAMCGSDIAMNQTCYALISRDGMPFFLHCHFRYFVNALVFSAHGSVFDTITTKASKIGLFESIFLTEI